MTPEEETPTCEVAEQKTAALRMSLKRPRRACRLEPASF
jgi:hypothetical protein